MATSTKRFLIAPLNWGLGHATRCIPLVEQLLQMKHQVFAVLTPVQLVVFEEHFGNKIGYVKLNEAPVHYKFSFAVSMVLQMPRFISQRRYEEKLAEQLIEKIKPDLIISDNRFGFRSFDVPSVIISHQLQLRAGLLSFVANKINHSLLNRFDAVWVPDYETAPGLSGNLSHGKKPGVPVHYLGPLSRLKPTSPNPAKQKYDVLALLSGPEPQRSILEDKLLEVLVGSGLKVAIVRGIPEEQNDLNEKNSNENINEFVWFNHLNAKNIGELISESKTIICRSGYSTLMDLAVLNRSAILIPTPGQTEQEYLAKHFEKQFGFRPLKQSQLKKLPQVIKTQVGNNADFSLKRTDFTPLEVLIEKLRL
jgi:uncharacterized protein (TIGR00661 family)